MLKKTGKICERIENANKVGLRTMLLIGMPQYFDYNMLPESYRVLMGATVSTIANASVTCIESPETLMLYKELLSDLLLHIPALDGMLVYTYDELAEICDENSDCPRCKGSPQEVRIAKYLNTIYNHLQSIKKGFSMWWEPWELSWSQVHGTLENLKAIPHKVEK